MQKFLEFFSNLGGWKTMTGFWMRAANNLAQRGRDGIAAYKEGTHDGRCKTTNDGTLNGAAMESRRTRKVPMTDGA